MGFQINKTFENGIYVSGCYTKVIKDSNHYQNRKSTSILVPFYADIQQRRNDSPVIDNKVYLVEEDDYETYFGVAALSASGVYPLSQDYRYLYEKVPDFYQAIIILEPEQVAPNWYIQT
jgi:hypothetical protein